VDFGTGDGAFVCDAARRSPDTLFIGVDATAENLRETSRRAARKPSRGGLLNAIFGRMTLADAPGELVAIADVITILFPWGSLLAAVALPRPEEVGRLVAIGRANANLRIVLSYDPVLDGGAASDLGPRRLDDPARLDSLVRAYREAGVALRTSLLSLQEARALPTTWAKKLSYSGRHRTFVQLHGRISSSPTASFEGPRSS
jgi:16S rRNA (adenine(1408)-N(1))-methyltransferase